MEIVFLLTLLTDWRFDLIFKLRYKKSNNHECHKMSKNYKLNPKVSHYKIVIVSGDVFVFAYIGIYNSVTKFCCINFGNIEVLEKVFR